MFHFRLLISILGLFFISACTHIPDDSGADSAPKLFLDPEQIEDAIPTIEPLSRYGNPSSYEIKGVRYHLLNSNENYREVGKASWYGNKFHGRLTSNREIYNMYEMTAAHKTLPIPCYVEVTNLENGRKAIVRVNDRGPFIEDRIIDLSYAAATKLGVLDNGTATVLVKQIGPIQSTTQDAKQQATHNSTMQPG